MKNLEDKLQGFNFSQQHSERIFHGRGHCYPGLEWLTVDWFNPVLFVGLYKNPDEQDKLLLEKLLDATPAPIVAIQHRYNKNQITMLRGKLPGKWFACENGLDFQLDTGQQNIGFFLDMEPVRSWLIKNCENKRVLNLFSYTCSLSVAACAGNASSVCNIDLSARSLARGQLNHHLNGFASCNLIYLSHNIFKSWGKLQKYGPYDLVIVDPPTFQKGSFDIQKDYQKLLTRLSTMVSGNADIILSVNSPRLDCGFIDNEIREAGLDWTLVKTFGRAQGFKEPNQNTGLKVLLYRSSPGGV